MYLPIQQFKTWVTPLKCFGLDAIKNKLLIVAPNRFKLDFAKKQFAGVIYQIAQKFWANVGLDFSLYNPNAIHTHSAFKNQNLDLTNLNILENFSDTKPSNNSGNSEQIIEKTSKKQHDNINLNTKNLNNNFINLDSLDIFEEMSKKQNNNS